MRKATTLTVVSFHFQSNQTFCASFFLSVFMQLPTREHLRKFLLKTNCLTCQCNQTSLHHNLYRFAFLSEPCYVSIGNCKLLSGRGSLLRQWGQREVYNLDYVTE